MTDVLNILVLEDEQHAGKKLLALIEEIVPNAKIEWHRSISDGKSYLEEDPKLDLMFSDIELLDGNVFSLFEMVTPPCPIIFCTAYDDYYVSAFQTNGIAYLLKPYTKEQFGKAWEKYKVLFKEKSTSAPNAHLMDSLQLLLKKTPTKYKKSFTVKKNSGVYLLKTETISYFQANGDYVFAFDQEGAKHLLNNSLKEIEECINPNQFFRINRGEIVNFDEIIKYEAYIKNRLAITLSSSKTVVYTSNSRTPEFKQWIETH